MKKAIVYLICAAILFSCRAAMTPDGVKATLHQITYDLIAEKSGELKQVKKKENIVFTSSLDKAVAVAATSYNDDIKVTKASAPGAKPEYRQSMDEGIFYNDSRMCFLVVPLQKGKESKAEFEVLINDPADFGHIGISTPYPTDTYIVTINMPSSVAHKMRITPLNMPESVEIQESIGQKGDLTYELRLTNVQPTKKEKLAPSLSLSCPQLLVTGHFQNVNELYSYIHQYIDNSSSQAAATLASQLTEDCSDVYSKIDTIAAWVRNNIRYIAIEHGDLGMRPDGPDQVLDKRYGDCKGSANLIKHMLRSQGIDARLAWIATADYTRLRWDEYPLSSLGNHMIAAAVLPDTIIYIDGTAKYSPNGYLSEIIQGQSALIEDVENQCMVRTVPIVKNKNTDISNVVYTLENTTLKGSAKKSLSGNFCRIYEEIYNGTTAALRTDAIREILSNGKASMTITDLNYCRPYPTSPTLDVAYTIHDASRIKTAGKYRYVDINPMDYYALTEVDTAGRARGITLPFTYSVEKTSTLHLPEGTQGVECPAPTIIDSPYFGAKIEYTTSDNEIVCNSVLTIRRKEASPEEIGEWNSAVKALQKAISARVKLPVR